MWKRLLFSYLLVALAALPAIVWGQTLTIGKNDGNSYDIPSCNTEAQMRDILSQGTVQGVRTRLAHYNNIQENNEPVCGRVLSDIFVLRVVFTVQVEQFTVTVVEYLYEVDGKPKKLYGMTTLGVHHPGRV